MHRPIARLKEGGAHRRSAQTDCQVEDQDDTEMDSAHRAQGICECGRLDDRKQDRRHDHDERSHVHEAAKNQQQQVDDEQQDIGIRSDSDEGVRDPLGDSQHRHHVGESLGGRDEREDNGEGLE